MEINEKLDIFFEAAIAAANRQSEEILEEQKSTYQLALSEYEENKQAGALAREHAMEARLKKEANRMVSEQVLQKKRAYHTAAEQKKKELFARVEEKLEDYRSGQAYEDFLLHLIAQAKQFAGEEAVAIYLTPSDAKRKERLEQKSGMTLAVSGDEFLGGIRAVIAAKNILLDETFLSRLEQERENYSF